MAKKTAGRYRRQHKVYKLNFADEEMAGLVVRARSAPVSQFIGLTKLAELEDGNVTPQDMERVDELFRGFAACLVDWNLDAEDGTPVPATLEGLYSQETGFVLAIIFAWIEAIAGVSPPLGKRSSAGARSLEPSIPMEALSASPRSSRTQSSS